MQEGIKIKEPWSTKKILLTFLLIGLVFGLLLSVLDIYLDMVDLVDYYNNDCLNHTHDDDCYDFYDYFTGNCWGLHCSKLETAKEYDSGLDYAKSIMARRDVFVNTFIPKIAFCVGSFGLVSGIVLFVRKSKKRNKVKQEKNHNIVKNILD